jgi:hypothetical protein
MTKSIAKANLRRAEAGEKSITMNALALKRLGLLELKNISFF